MRRRLFTWLYQAWFSNGQAYLGIWQWRLADLVKALSR